MIKQILIVDDNEIDRDSYRETVEKLGIGVNVAEAGDGTEALVKVNKVWPDLILLDIQMTPMNGYEFLKRLWLTCEENNYPKPRHLVMSAHAHNVDFFRDNQQEYAVLKPVSEKALGVAVLALCGLTQGVVKVGGRGVTVLVAEEDQGFAKSLHEALINIGFTVVGCVHDGLTLLKTAIVVRPDVIVARKILRAKNGDKVAILLSECAALPAKGLFIYDSDALSESNVFTTLVTNSPAMIAGGVAFGIANV